MKQCDVLIIDDDFDDIEILMEELNNNGLDQVHYVYSAKDAFQYLEDVFPDCIPKVIVTDVQLPVVNGIEFMQQLKKLDRYKDVKVVVLSTTLAKQHEEALRELEPHDFFLKPSDLRGYSIIARKIRQHVMI